MEKSDIHTYCGVYICKFQFTEKLTGNSIIFTEKFSNIYTMCHDCSWQWFLNISLSGLLYTLKNHGEPQRTLIFTYYIYQHLTYQKLKDFNTCYPINHIYYLFKLIIINPLLINIYNIFLSKIAIFFQKISEVQYCST